MRRFDYQELDAFTRRLRDEERISAEDAGRFYKRKSSNGNTLLHQYAGSIERVYNEKSTALDYTKKGRLVRVDVKTGRFVKQ
jgi:hypothetical protein